MFMSVDLPGAGGAHDGDVLALLDGDVHAFEGMNLLGAHDVGLPEVLSLDDWHFFGFGL